MKLASLLEEMFKQGASDLHLTADRPPELRIDGELRPMADAPLTAEQVQKCCYEAITEEQQNRFEEAKELDFSFSHGTNARVRGNFYYDRTNLAGAFRMIPMKIPKPEDMGVPDIAMRMIEKPRGLILVTGPTGSGKSTTLATMIERINQTQSKHIITIEDPIEFLYMAKKCLINQREVGEDTLSFAEGLKHILRQDPDIVLIGEMRDLETISAALTLSETGHLVFATLHTNTTPESIDRIIDVFPAHQQSQIRTQLSFVIEAIMAQKLIPKVGGGRALAMEIMLPSYAIRNLIRENKAHQIYSHMLTGQAASGMQTMNQALAELVKQGSIDRQVALMNTSDRDDLEKQLGPGLRATAPRP